MPIQSYDDSDFQQTVAAFRAYLATCRKLLAVHRPAPQNLKKPAKRKVSSRRKQAGSRHVYLLEGPRPPAVVTMVYKPHRAGLWAA